VNEAEARAILQQADSQLVAAILLLVRREVERATGGTANSTDVRKLEGPLTVHGTLELVATDDPPAVGTTAPLVMTSQASSIQTISARVTTAPSTGPLSLQVTRLRSGATLMIASLTLAVGQLEARTVPPVADCLKGDWFGLAVTATDGVASGLVVALDLLVAVGRG
jgi:hypothetical protein